MADKQKRKELKDGLAPSAPGFALLGALLVGVLAGASGLLAVLSSEFSGAGLCFLAAGVSFGLAANAIFRR